MMMMIVASVLCSSGLCARLRPRGCERRVVVVVVGLTSGFRWLRGGGSRGKKREACDSMRFAKGAQCPHVYDQR